MNEYIQHLSRAGGASLNMAGSQVLMERAQTINHISSQIGNINNNFFTDCVQRYQPLMNVDFNTLIEDQRLINATILNLNTITITSSFDDIVRAKPVMQEWHMANPRLNTLLRNDSAEGWNGAFDNYRYKDCEGILNIDTCKVQDGILRLHTNDDGVDEAVISHYLHCESGNDTELSMSQKIAILMSWDVMDSWLDHGIEDPTSQNGSML